MPPAQNTYKVLIFDNYESIGHLILDHPLYSVVNQATNFARLLNVYHSANPTPIMKKLKRYAESGVGRNRVVNRNLVTEIMTDKPFQQYIGCPMPSLIPGKGILVYHETLLFIPLALESLSTETLTWDTAVTAGHVLE